MVDVAHHRDDGRALGEILLVVLLDVLRFLASSSAAVTISTLRSNCLAIDSTDSSVSVWVRVAI